MIFNVQERLALLPLFPREGNFLTLKIIRNAQDKISFSEEEYKEFNLQFDKNKDQVSWNAAGSQGKEIELGEKAVEILREQLVKIDSENKLNQTLFSCYEKIVGPCEPDDHADQQE